MFLDCNRIANGFAAALGEPLDEDSANPGFNINLHFNGLEDGLEHLF